MSVEYNDDPNSDFPDFEDFMASLEPGRKARSWGILRYREGNDPHSWAGPGATIYIPTDYQILVGASKWTGSARTSGAYEVTFPVVFADLPLIFATPISTTPLFQDVRIQCPPSSGAAFEWYWFAGANLTVVTVSWLAIGPVGTG